MSVYVIDNGSGPVSFSYQASEIERDDPSLNGLEVPSLQKQFVMNPTDLNRAFFSVYGIEYITEYFSTKNLDFRVVTHPCATNTCYEKARLLGEWDPLNVIKALYFESSLNDALYAIVIPETGCFVDRTHIKSVLNLAPDDHLPKAQALPANMSFGTCSPFVTHDDITAGGGRVAKVLFDRETLINKRNTNSMDDFSFGLDHRMSIQMNYYQCYRMLKSRYPGVVCEQDVLNLAFKGKLVRSKGRVSIVYEFNSLNYRSAEFINSTYGYGDVSVSNDYVDELDLPEVLTVPPKAV